MMPCTALGVTAVTTPTTTADYGNNHDRQPWLMTSTLATDDDHS
jgi:hypothetical protein